MGAGPEDLEVEVDLVERERDVLVGLGLDRELEVLLLLAGGHDDLLGDHHGGRQGEGDVAVPGAEALPGPLQPVAHLVQVGDVAVGDDVLGQRLDDVPLEPADALARRPTSSTSLIDVELMSTPISAGDFTVKMSRAEPSFSAIMAASASMLTIYIKGWQQV